MRQILFRGQREDNEEWVEGYYFKYGEEVVIIEDDVCYLDHSCLETDYAILVNPDTVGQYTGLTDKNGKKIFEGDVVFVTDEDGYSGQVDTGVGGIELLEGLWYICGRVQNSLYDIDKNFQIEVIGNAYDNPELIEENEDI